MSSKLHKKVSDLAKELERDIATLESELAEKKALHAKLSDISGKAPRRRAGKRGPGRPKKAAGMVKRATGGQTGRRKSKNRDIILAAASKLKGKFSLAELKSKIHEKHPKFGGKFASGTILATLRTTPEIKKLARGTYVLKK